MGPTGRAAAYSELVAGLLDVRDESATHGFDAALRAAVADGHLDEQRAATLRWLQRLSVDAVVEHARSALPAALLGLDEARQAVTSLQSSSRQPESVSGASSERSGAAPRETPDDATTPFRDSTPHSAREAPARRLLVAGLTALSVPTLEPRS